MVSRSVLVERDLKTETKRTHTIKVSCERLLELVRAEYPDLPDRAVIVAVGEIDVDDIHPFNPKANEGLVEPRFRAYGGLELIWTEVERE